MGSISTKRATDRVTPGTLPGLSPPAAQATGASSPVDSLPTDEANFKQAMTGSPLKTESLLETVQGIASSTLARYGGNGDPGPAYQSTQIKRDQVLSANETYKAVRWDEVNSYLQARLTLVQEVIGQAPDPKLTRAKQLAADVLQTHPWSPAGSTENGSREVYSAYYDALNEITALTRPADTPAAKKDRSESAVGEAVVATEGLRSLLDGSFVKTAADRARAKIESNRSAQAEIPTWQKLLGFGLFKEHQLQDANRTLQRRLDTLDAISASPYMRRATALLERERELSDSNAGDATASWQQLRQEAQDLHRSVNKAAQQANFLANELM